MTGKYVALDQRHGLDLVVRHRRLDRVGARGSQRAAQRDRFRRRKLIDRVDPQRRIGADGRAHRRNAREILRWSKRTDLHLHGGEPLREVVLHLARKIRSVRAVAIQSAAGVYRYGAAMGEPAGTEHSPQRLVGVLCAQIPQRHVHRAPGGRRHPVRDVLPARIERGGEQRGIIDVAADETSTRVREAVEHVHDLGRLRPGFAETDGALVRAQREQGRAPLVPPRRRIERASVERAPEFEHRDAGDLHG